MVQSNPPSQNPRSGLLRRADQLAVAIVTLIALVVLACQWWAHGGNRGQLIEIDHTPARQIDFLVDVNTASWPELTQLPDIGEILARRIIQRREEEGIYRHREDLLRVRGIGPKTLEKIRPYLYTQEQALEASSSLR